MYDATRIITFETLAVERRSLAEGLSLQLDELAEKIHTADRRFRHLRYEFGVADFDALVGQAIADETSTNELQDKLRHVVREAALAKKSADQARQLSGNIREKLDAARADQHASERLARRCRVYATEQGLKVPETILDEAIR